MALLAAWGSTGACDFGDDGRIDQQDLGLLLDSWGSCAEPAQANPGFPDPPPRGAPVAAADLDGDGRIGHEDLGALRRAWGPCPGCPADLDRDGVVGVNDHLALLSRWD